MQADQRYLLRPGRHGLFLVNPRDRYVGRSMAEYGEFSEWEVAALLRLLQPGAIVVEAGANMGAITVPIARHVGREGCVFAYEPQRLTFQQLCGNLALNAIDNVVAIWGACGAARASIRVPVLDPDGAANIGGLALLDSSGRDNPDGEQVAVETIDGLGLDRCDMIKADVEGMERQVLAGARDTIKRCRPILYVENDRPENGAALVDDVLALGYRGWWHTPPLFNERNWTKRPDDVWRREEGRVFVSINMLCVPNESSVTVEGLPPIVAGEGQPRVLQVAA